MVNTALAAPYVELGAADTHDFSGKRWEEWTVDTDAKVFALFIVAAKPGRELAVVEVYGE